MVFLTFQGFATRAGQASLSYLLPPTTICCLPRLPAASHDYLLPPTTTCCLPRLPAASHDYLLPPKTTCCLSRLPAASHDYLLPPKRLGSKAGVYLFRLTKIEKSSNRCCSSQFWWAQCTESFSVVSYHGVALLAILLAMSELAQLVLDRSRYWSAL